MKKLITLFCLLLAANFTFSQNGLKADFYDGRNFDRYVSSRIDKNIDYYWNNTPPVEGIDPHDCSIRWTGKLKAPKTGVYKFSARVDDGIQVWVGGVLVIDNWQLNDVGISEGFVKMRAGQMYNLKVEYFNALIEGEITLLWELPQAEEKKSWFESWWGSDESEIISPKYFFPPPVKEIRGTADIMETTPKKIEKKPVPVAKKTEEKSLEAYLPKNIAFEQAKSEILPKSFSELDILANFLVLNEKYRLTIEGHTDTPGDAQKNLVLSQKRANAVAAYLVKKGVKAERLEAKGFGGSRPLVTSKERKYHPKNRRVEFILK